MQQSQSQSPSQTRDAAPERDTAYPSEARNMPLSQLMQFPTTSQASVTGPEAGALQVSNIGWQTTYATAHDVHSVPHFVLGSRQPMERTGDQEGEGDNSSTRATRRRKRRNLEALQKNTRGDPQLADGIPRVIEISSNLLYAPGGEESKGVEGRPPQHVDLATVCKRARQYVLSQVKEWANKMGFLVHLKGTAEGNAFLISCHRYGRTNERNPARCGCQWVVRYVFDADTSTAFIRSYPHHDHNHSLGKNNTRQGGIFYIEGNRIVRSDRAGRNHPSEIGGGADETEGSYGSDETAKETQIGAKRRLPAQHSAWLMELPSSSEPMQPGQEDDKTKEIASFDAQLDSAWTAAKAWAQPSEVARTALLTVLKRLPSLLSDPKFRQFLGETEQMLESAPKHLRISEGSRSGPTSSYVDSQHVEPGGAGVGHYGSVHSTFSMPGRPPPHFDYHGKTFAHHTGEGYGGLHSPHPMTFTGRPAPFYPSHSTPESSSFQTFSAVASPYERQILPYTEYLPDTQRFPGPSLTSRAHQRLAWSGQGTEPQQARPGNSPLMHSMPMPPYGGMMMPERAAPSQSYAEWEQLQGASHVPQAHGRSSQAAPSPQAAPSHVREQQTKTESSGTASWEEV